MDYKKIKKCDSTFYLNPTSADEILTIIKNMPDKASGVDNLNMKVLKTLSPYIVKPIYL